MVYTKLFIVVGVIVSKSEIKSMLKITNTDDIPYYYIHDDIEIFRFQCCSDSSNKKFLIGIKLHTYYRKYINCNNCGANSVCDKCIGYTNNGYYDVQTILNQPTKVNIRNVCMNCYADTKHDLGSREQTCEIVNNLFIDDGEDAYKRKCKVCNCTPSGYRSPEDTLEFHCSEYSRVKKYVKNSINRTPKLYYMIDDCLSCT